MILNSSPMCEFQVQHLLQALRGDGSLVESGTAGLAPPRPRRQGPQGTHHGPQCGQHLPGEVAGRLSALENFTIHQTELTYFQQGIVIFLVFAMKRDTLKKLKARASSLSGWLTDRGLMRVNNSSLNSGGSSNYTAVRLRPSEFVRSDGDGCSKRSTAMSDVRFVLQGCPLRQIIIRTFHHKSVSKRVVESL